LLVEVRVQELGLDNSNKTPVVLLQELQGERVLPIWIGPSEARAIAVQMAEIPFPRPLTHDLFCSLLRGLGGTLQKVIVTRMEGGTYYAQLLVERNGEVFSVDARPSDSIAVALRANARVFVDDELLEADTIEISEGEETPQGLPFAATEEGNGPGPVDMGPEELKEHLQRLAPEDFGRFNP
jgi:hypothetical protein